MAPASLLLLASAAAANAAAEGPWLDGFNGTFPCDVLFVKGKKVAGTTLGGVVRRLGGRHGVDFFSPGVPAKTPADWRSGGRERWILDEFAAFAARRAPGRHLGWGQEQTLSPRRRGLEASSRPLVELAAGALRVTVVREPVAHAVSACTHFGPCGARSANAKAAYNASAAARLRWVAEDLTTAQMLRFLSHEPRAIADSGRGAAEAAAAFYHAILLADAVDESLVAFALAVPGVALEDVLYVSAKTTHTARRPATERLSDGFREGLVALFYGAGRDAPPARLARGDRPDDLAPDAHLYLAARARLDATIDAVGRRTFDVALRRFRKLQQRMLAACAKPGDRPKGSLPGNLKPRDAAACIYGDQGCGHKCIDAFLADRAARLRSREGAAPDDAGRRRRDRLHAVMAARHVGDRV